MSVLTKYIAGRGEAPSKRELNRIVEHYEWFTTARRARTLITYEADPALALPLMFWPTVRPVLRGGAHPKVVSEPAVTDVSADLIDRFIEHGGYRIDPAGEAGEVKVDVDIDPEMVTPELAEIYRAQGRTAEAEKIYRTLNLRNS
jgi:hypothetical protein